MIRVRIQYDKYNRTFKVLDKEFGPLLEDGDTYELLVPTPIRKDDAEDESLFEVSTLAHA